MQEPKENVTVRIEEGTSPADAESAAAKMDANAKETKVVFLRSGAAEEACYYRGYHDGVMSWQYTAFATGFVMVVLAFLVLRKYAAK